MELQQAELISQEIIKKITPFCSKVAIAGSIRRRKQFCHDIDICCIVEHQVQFLSALQELGKIKSGAGKLINVVMPNGTLVDFYIATPEIWATLLLIRTGSKEHNIKLCSLARQKGMMLKADGSGLFNIAPDLDSPYRAARIAGETETSIFAALGMPYKRPEERN